MRESSFNRKWNLAPLTFRSCQTVDNDPWQLYITLNIPPEQTVIQATWRKRHPHLCHICHYFFYFQIAQSIRGTTKFLTQYNIKLRYCKHQNELVLPLAFFFFLFIFKMSLMLIHTILFFFPTLVWLCIKTYVVKIRHKFCFILKIFIEGQLVYTSLA